MTSPIPTTATDHVIQQVPTRTRTLHGMAASPGRYAGTVRVIHSEAEFDRLRAGDVLVCPVILPVWTVLFPMSVHWSPTPAESCPTRQSTPANAASPQSLRPA
jgi:phosphoenolpyruvate synthase/pyruvate phosphate dikinase